MTRAKVATAKYSAFYTRPETVNQRRDCVELACEKRERLRPTDDDVTSHLLLRVTWPAHQSSHLHVACDTRLKITRYIHAFTGAYRQPQQLHEHFSPSVLCSQYTSGGTSLCHVVRDQTMQKR